MNHSPALTEWCNGCSVRRAVRGELCDRCLMLNRPSFAYVCEHGGHWCRRCQRYVTPEESDVGLPRRCPHCHNIRLRFDPPLDGYHSNTAKDGNSTP